MDSVKQSAALCLLRLNRMSPDLIPMGEWTSRVVHLLNDQHLVCLRIIFNVLFFCRSCRHFHTPRSSEQKGYAITELNLTWLNRYSGDSKGAAPYSAVSPLLNTNLQTVAACVCVSVVTV